MGTDGYEATTDRVSFSGGETYLFDADGSALVIHAKADDQATDPVGDSGDRVACGVIKTSATSQKESPASGSSGALPLMLGAVLSFVLLVVIFL